MSRTHGTLGIRISAIVVLGLLVAYQVLRLIAGNCNGAGCDVYIPVSILLPLVILVMVGVTGMLTILAARRRRQEEGGRAWLSLMVASTLLGVLGPAIGVGVFRDAPDVLVPLATALFALVPVVALGYSFRRPGRT